MSIKLKHPTMWLATLLSPLFSKKKKGIMCYRSPSVRPETVYQHLLLHY